MMGLQWACGPVVSQVREDVDRLTDCSRPARTRARPVCTSKGHAAFSGGVRRMAAMSFKDL